MAWTWRLLQAGREVGRIVLHDDGRVEARGPDGFPESERRAIEEGRASFREFGWSDRPRPGLDALPEYWHWVLTAGHEDRWDAVDTNYKPPVYPIVDERGGRIFY